ILDGAFSDARTSRYSYNALSGIADQTYGDHADPAQATRILHATNDRGLPARDTWVNQSYDFAGYTQAATGGQLSRALTGVYNFATAWDSLGRVTAQTVQTRMAGQTGLRTRADEQPSYDDSDDVKSLRWALAADGNPAYETFAFGYDAQHQLT